MLLNTIYTTDQTLNNAAEMIYTDDPAKRERYRIPSNSPSNSQDEEESGDDGEGGDE
jgi:hypothetical protein